eukprot:UN30304
MRRKMLDQCRGVVLEVCAGTGRNLKYFPSNVEVILSDKCPEMLEKCKSKPVAKKLQFKQFRVEDACKMSYEDESFDTVVDTFGLCSIEDPMEALEGMYRVCKVGGRILLLGHGESSFTPIARMQANDLNRHVHLWGCYYNRNILDYIKDLGTRHGNLT